jgi:hypothetical protein
MIQWGSTIPLNMKKIDKINSKKKLAAGNCILKCFITSVES